ncbi:hypothetical protein BV25DRAFT_803426 [Artomyces pyxidatus]|uniref:Uncharacterized protein n=1 Tax=Artomyces pyxidatus TaxID=48021 RepID=A0ACB8SY84_9AGAM|nr:hypothetical protein BV25DRAFT_803426 [Artomyces pyxidatus]
MHAVHILYANPRIRLCTNVIIWDEVPRAMSRAATRTRPRTRESRHSWQLNLRRCLISTSKHACGHSKPVNSPLCYRYARGTVACRNVSIEPYSRVSTKDMDSLHQPNLGRPSNLPSDLF